MKNTPTPVLNNEVKRMGRPLDNSSIRTGESTDFHEKIARFVREELQPIELPVETFLRDVRLYRLFEGTSEIQRLVNRA